MNHQLGLHNQAQGAQKSSGSLKVLKKAATMLLVAMIASTTSKAQTQDVLSHNTDTIQADTVHSEKIEHHKPTFEREVTGETLNVSDEAVILSDSSFNTSFLIGYKNLPLHTRISLYNVINASDINNDPDYTKFEVAKKFELEKMRLEGEIGGRGFRNQHIEQNNSHFFESAGGGLFADINYETKKSHAKYKLGTSVSTEHDGETEEAISVGREKKINKFPKFLKFLTVQVNLRGHYVNQKPKTDQDHHMEEHIDPSMMLHLGLSKEIPVFKGKYAVRLQGDFYQNLITGQNPLTKSGARLGVTIKKKEKN